MSKPIAQSFYINEPINGVEGVILTKVEIFFQNVSKTDGVELQIRTVENGQPTSYRLPDASKILKVTDRHPNNSLMIVSSADATLPTIFEFDTPIPLQSQTSYALVIIPVGGNPDYKVWSAELGATDVTTGTPIFNNNETGDLFLASNDRTFTPIINEDMKFNLYIANFTATSGTAVYKLDNFENIIYHSQTKSFITKEPIYMSEANYNLAKLTMTSNTAAFINDEVIYQSNGSANVATGIVYGSNSTSIKIANSSGSWSTAFQVRGVTSTANATISTVSQSVASYSNSTITVPFGDVFYANQMIYVATNDRYDMQVCKVTAVTDTTVSLFTNVEFTDSDCLIGKVRGDNGLLFGFIDGPVTETTALRNVAIVGSSRANSTVNFANSEGCYLIGQISKASALCYATTDLIYNSVFPSYATVDSKSTAVDFSFSGVERYTYAYDTANTLLTNGYETELTDKARMLMSRSNEYVKKSGDTTFKIYANVSTSNTKFSPIISDYKRHVNFLRNITVPENDLSGYILNISNTNNIEFIEKVDVTQNNTSYSVNGVVYFANSTIMYVASNSDISFQTGNTVYVSSNSSINATVTAVTRFSEIYNDSVNTSGSRYISKTVVLADKQDAEDLRCYISAYRPAGTNLVVYSKVVNNEDPEPIFNKYWSRMSETSESSLLLSSGSNPDDFVELVYNFPTATETFGNSVSCNTTSANVTVPTTSGINQYDYVYLYFANSTVNQFIVRQVTEIANNTTLIVNKTPTFTQANCKFGTIPGIEDASGAFVFPDNNYIVRYVSNNDVVYDGFKSFNVKIVPVSNSTHLVPRADDMRCLALQV